MTPYPGRRTAGLLAAAGLVLALAANNARAERINPDKLPEQVTIAEMPAAEGRRVYLSDPALNHLLDGRMHVVEGGKMRYLGLIGSGFAGLIQLSRDGRYIYVATTYFSRLQRGKRTDVVEVYRSADLVFEHEIEIPPRRAQGLQIKALTAMSADDRFLFIQNATPATTITVVDLAERRVAAEIANPGCWGVVPWPSRARRISTVCADGSTTSFDLDERGALVRETSGPAFFDSDVDPVFMHFEQVGERLIFASFQGKLHTLRMAEEGLVADGTPWSMVGANARKAGWRPGGFQLFAVEPGGRRLVVAMHDGGGEGSHKNPAKELWVFDLAEQKRVARLPGQVALSMTFAPTASPMLYLLSAADNRILRYDFSAPKLPKAPTMRSEPVGETPVYLVLQ